MGRFDAAAAVEGVGAVGRSCSRIGVGTDVGTGGNESLPLMPCFMASLARWLMASHSL